jgi:histidinol dehydrogenase
MPTWRVQAPAVRRGRIDLLAGPTEILVLADEHADPSWWAVDLLSQAEHGPDIPGVLVTTSREVADQALAHIERILPDMPTKDFRGAGLERSRPDHRGRLHTTRSTLSPTSWPSSTWRC